MAHDQMPEHEFEGAYGLPQPLPQGEKMLWQGAPDWRVLARTAMHVNAFSVYFAVLLAWRAVTVLSNGGSWIEASIAVAWLLPLAVVAIALLGLMAWLTARTSVYSITDRRVVMRVGIVLSITFNLPYRQIESAGLRLAAKGTGDIALLLDKSSNIAYLNLWPHAKPGQIARTQPMLRGLPDAARVAGLLADALDAYARLDPRAPAGTTPPVPVTEAAVVGSRARQPMAA